MARKRKSENQASGRKEYGLRILHAIRKIIRAVDLDSRQLAAQHKITTPQLLSLMAMVEKQPTTSIELAKRMHVDASTLVGIMDRLEAKGLIKRERDAEDRRKIWIRVTEAGQTLVAKTPFPLQYSLDRALKQLSSKERTQIADSLDRLVELVAAPDIDASPILDVLGAIRPGS
jgi:DNA-binding MarR family transcriptional regulator